MHFSRYFKHCLLLLWAAILVGGQGIESIDSEIEVILVKIGGSSITNKGEKESLNDKALAWFSQTLKTVIARTYRSPADDQCESDGLDESARSLAFVVVHGAGSFGHFSAKAYGLKGQTENPQNSSNNSSVDKAERRFRMKGVSETRLSVQKLNRLVVSSLVDHGINSVGISPCFGIPHLQAHATNEKGALTSLSNVVRESLYAGLVPVLHGDACLFGDNAGILGGDTLMEVLGKTSWVSRVVFITDVDGVYTEDPRKNPEGARLLQYIPVDGSSGDITIDVSASGSSHDHDVTGGLKVRNRNVLVRMCIMHRFRLRSNINYSLKCEQTKLKSAATIASAGKNVTIVKCGSGSAVQALSGESEVEVGSIIF
jgi:isopentenyl phosphate kinase